MICIILRCGWDYMVSAFSKILAVAYSLGMIQGFIKKHGVGWLYYIHNVSTIFIPLSFKEKSNTKHIFLIP